jgi:pimeloyl-ACP methyl ester carboxylesterase
MEIHWNDSSLFYEKTGNGADSLLLFHGFGQDHTVFAPLIKSIQSRYTCYSFDLFYHGQSRWANPDEPLSTTHWANLLRLFLETERLARFSVLGFSMGARLALATFEILPHMTANIFLLAPDGIRNHLVYRLATSHALNRFIFQGIIRSQNLFELISSGARRLGLVDPKLLRFVDSQMSSEVKRMKVYNTWLVFRALKFDQSKLAEKINRNNSTVYFFLAENDSMISEKGLRKFISLLNDPVVQKVDARHNQLISAIAGKFLALTKDRSENQQ